MQIVIMGVAGSGKSSIGVLLAQKLHIEFVDGDDLHPPSNIQKMSSGIPITDTDREPWLIRIRDLLKLRDDDGIIIACSALKKSYRDLLRSGNPNLKFIFLDGDYQTILNRIKSRSDHFLPTDLLTSQFATLEAPTNEPDVLKIEVTQSPENIVNDVYKWLFSHA